MKKSDDWFGIVRWCNDDIKNALEELGYESTEENILKIRNILEHHSFTDMMIETGWNVINQTIEENLNRDFRICSRCGKKISNGRTDEVDYWCDVCFDTYMNETFGPGRWTGVSEENDKGGYYWYLDDYGNWQSLNIYWTEWED